MIETVPRRERTASGNYIGGGWRASVNGASYQKGNPARVGDVVGEFPASDEADVDAAVSAAANAFPEWSALPVAGRAALLGRAADLIDARTDEIALDMTTEMGK